MLSINTNVTGSDICIGGLVGGSVDNVEKCYANISIKQLIQKKASLKEKRNWGNFLGKRIRI